MTGIAVYRYAPPIGLAAAATVGLLLLMQALIHVDELRVQDPILSPPIQIVPVIEERPPVVPPRTPSPPLPELPPEVVLSTDGPGSEPSGSFPSAPHGLADGAGRP